VLLQELPLELLPPRAACLSAEVMLICMPAGSDLDLIRYGAAPPYGTVDVILGGAPHRIAALRRDSRTDPPWLELPFDAGSGSEPQIFSEDVLELAEELDEASQRRLLAFLLGFCRKAFSLAHERQFAAMCLRLAQLCVPHEGIAQPVATVTPAWMVLTGVQVPSDATLFILGPTSIRQSVTPRLDGHPFLQLVERVAPGDVLLALSERALFWTVRDASASLRDVVRVFAPSHALRIACLRALAKICPATVSILREGMLLTPATAQRHEDPARPIGAALEAAIPDGTGQLFLRFWLRDPEALIAGAELCTPLGNIDLDLASFHRVRRADVAGQFARAAFLDADTRTGFVARVPDPSNGLCLQPTLALRLHSGARITATPPMRHLPPAAARSAVLASVPMEEVTPAMLDDCLGPVAAGLHREVLARRGKPDVVQIGKPISRPAISIVVPLYRNLGFLRFQLATLADDPDCRRAELIFVLDSPEQRAETEHLLRGLHAMHALPITLVILPENLGYAAANNAGAALARGRLLLLLNSDVVPTQPGWLVNLRTELERPGIGGVGPKLLFDDESIQHAGLYFEQDLDGIWFNAHYHKGMPRLWPAAQRRRFVPGVTGAALMTSRALFEQVGGICEDYIVGDYEDSDFCLRLHAAGAAVRYVPQVELYHFERRSIALHTGYTGTLASQYNRRLHHRRWDARIADLMTKGPGRRATRSAT
jgi:O-antigen biosynthesis protein